MEETRAAAPRTKFRLVVELSAETATSADDDGWAPSPREEVDDVARELVERYEPYGLAVTSIEVVEVSAERSGDTGAVTDS